MNYLDNSKSFSRHLVEEQHEIDGEGNNQGNELQSEEIPCQETD